MPHVARGDGSVPNHERVSPHPLQAVDGDRLEGGLGRRAADDHDAIGNRSRDAAECRRPSVEDQRRDVAGGVGDHAALGPADQAEPADSARLRRAHLRELSREAMGGGGGERDPREARLAMDRRRTVPITAG
jgi:hypothetical protein